MRLTLNADGAGTAVGSDGLHLNLPLDRKNYDAFDIRCGSPGAWLRPQLQTRIKRSTYAVGPIKCTVGK